MRIERQNLRAYTLRAYCDCGAELTLAEKPRTVRNVFRHLCTNGHEALLPMCYPYTGLEAAGEESPAVRPQKENAR